MCLVWLEICSPHWIRTLQILIQCILQYSSCMYIYIYIFLSLFSYIYNIYLYRLYIYIIEIQSDCFKTDPLRGQNQLLSTLIHSYPLLSTLIPLLSTLIPLLSTLIQLLSTLIQLLSNSYPLLSNSYPTLIHSYSLLTLRVMFFTLIHSCSLLSTLNKYGRFRINGVYLDLKWCINGKDCGSKWISARKIGVLGLTSSWHWGRQCVLGVLTC